MSHVSGVVLVLAATLLPHDGVAAYDSVDCQCTEQGSSSWSNYCNCQQPSEDINTAVVVLCVVMVLLLAILCVKRSRPILPPDDARFQHPYYNYHPERSNYHRQGHGEAPLPSHYESSLHSSSPPWPYHAAAAAAGANLHHGIPPSYDQAYGYDNSNSYYNASMMEIGGGGGFGGGADAGGGMGSGGGWDSGGGGCDTGGGGGGGGGESGGGGDSGGGGGGGD